MTTVHKLSLLVFVSLLDTRSSIAGEITQWNFNTQAGIGVNLSPSINLFGTPTISVIGVNQSLYGVGSVYSSSFPFGLVGGSSDPMFGPTAFASPRNFSYQLIGFPANGGSNFSAGIQVMQSTAGFQDVVVNWDQMSGALGSSLTTFQYTTNGGSSWNFVNNPSLLHGGTSSRFSEFGTLGTDSILTANISGQSVAYFSVNVGNNFYNNRTVDLTSISGVNNNPSFGYRVVAMHSPGTSNFQGLNGSYDANNAQMRFDMLTISAVAVPEPSVIVLTAIGAISISLFRAKWMGGPVQRDQLMGTPALLFGTRFVRWLQKTFSVSRGQNYRNWHALCAGAYDPRFYPAILT